MRIPEKQQNPADSLNIDKPYVLVLDAIEQRDNIDAPKRYTPQGKEVNPARIIWKFTVHDSATNDPIEGDDGTPVHLWASTSDSAYLDPQGTMTARARKFMHALSGRTLTDEQAMALLTTTEDDPHPLPHELVGSAAVGTLNHWTDSMGAQRVGIADLSVYIPKSRERRQKSQGAVVAAPAQSDDDLKDLPF
jgi:hypothetical protein